MDNQPNKLLDLYNIARMKGLAKSQTDFARLIGIDPANLSHAIKDDGRVNTDNTIRKAEHALMKAGVQLNANTAESIIVQGDDGTVGIEPKNFDNEAHWFGLVAKKDEQIDRLLTIIEKMQK